jgi:hypothetical protein
VLLLLLFVLSLLLFVLSHVLIVCTVPLPPGVNPIAVDKYIKYQNFSGRAVSHKQRPLPDNTQHLEETNIHAAGGIQTQNLRRLAATDLRLIPRGAATGVGSFLHYEKLKPTKYNLLGRDS